MEFTDEEMSVLITALEFVEKRYLTKRADFVRAYLYKKISEAQDALD